MADKGDRLVLGHFALASVHHDAEIVLRAELAVIAQPGLGLLDGFARVVTDRHAETGAGYPATPR